MAANAVLATVKLVAGLVGHSYALVADAVESFADIAGSAIVWGGLTLSAKPADDNHPYGHGKAEPLAALAVGLMLCAAAVGIGVKAVGEILRPHHAPATFTLYVLIGVVIVKESLFRTVRRVGAELDSTAIRADAWHHRSDALTSAAAAIGISVSLFAGEGYESADDWAAMAASGLIVFNGARFVRSACAELMDTQPSQDVLDGIATVARGVTGVRGVEKVLARKVGIGYWVDMHVEVNGALSVREGHDVAHRVKDAVRGRDPRVIDVLIHVEPYRE